MSVLDDPSLNRAERRRLQTYNRLKDAAGELLLSSGYSNITIKAITERADLGYGTFYLHFKDKDDIVWEINRDYFDEQRAQTEQLLEGIPFPRREYLGWWLFFGAAREGRDLFMEMFGSQGSAYLIQQFQEYMAETHVSNLERQVYEAGLELPNDFLSQFMSGALMRLMTWWLETPNDYTLKDITNMTYQTAYRQPPPDIPTEEFERVGMMVGET